MRHLAKLDELRFFLGICGALPQICMRCSQQLSFAAVVFFCIWQSDFAVAVISASAVMGLPNAK